MEYKMDNIKNSYTTLTNFKNINSKNGNYISNKVFGSKNVTKKLKIQASLVINKKIKKKWGNVLKKIHEFRVTNLNNIQNTECKEISDKLKNIKITNNNHFNLEVDNDEELNNNLQNLLKNYTDKDIDNLINSVFLGEKNSDKIENKDLIIDKNKLKKIAEDDFAIALKKIIAKVEDPKAIKYLYAFIDKLGEEKVSHKTISAIKKTLANKTNTIITDLLATESSDKQKIEEFHALLTICDHYNIEVSNNKQKKILDSCINCFNVIASNLNNTSHDIDIIKQQYKNLSDLKRLIIDPIIRKTVDNSDKKISITDDKLLFVQKWTDLTINKHNNLIKELDNNRKQVIDNSNKIALLIKKEEGLRYECAQINHKLLEKGLAKKQIKALKATKKDLDTKHQQSVSKLNNEWKYLYQLLDDGQDKQGDLNQHIQKYKNIPKNELPEKNYDYTEIINNDLQQQIDAKIADFPDNNSIKQLVYDSKIRLESVYDTTVSLILINSILANITKNDNFVTYFTQNINDYYTQANSENYKQETSVNETNQLQYGESQKSNKIIEDPIYMNVDAMNISNSFSSLSEQPVPPPNSIASVTENNKIPADKLQLPNRQNLLKDIRDPNQINRLKNVSINNTSENNKLEQSSAKKNTIEDSPVFKKARDIANNSTSSDETDTSDWD
jgi:hypothetical protein